MTKKEIKDLQELIICEALNYYSTALNRVTSFIATQDAELREVKENFDLYEKNILEKSHIIYNLQDKLSKVKSIVE